MFIASIFLSLPTPGLRRAGKEKTETLADSVKSINKRLEALENAPGERSSLEGQEDPPGEKRDGEIWEGLL
jgi:hypothetical protein